VESSFVVSRCRPPSPGSPRDPRTHTVAPRRPVRQGSREGGGVRPGTRSPGPAGGRDAGRWLEGGGERGRIRRRGPEGWSGNGHWFRRRFVPRRRDLTFQLPEGSALWSSTTARYEVGGSDMSGENRSEDRANNETRGAAHPPRSRASSSSGSRFLTDREEAPPAAHTPLLLLHAVRASRRGPCSTSRYAENGRCGSLPGTYTRSISWRETQGTASTSATTGSASSSARCPSLTGTAGRSPCMRPSRAWSSRRAMGGQTERA
jgi:hypothetical protein